MKIKNVIAGIVIILAVFIILGSCATGYKSITGSEEYYGIWINKDYIGNKFFSQKVVYYSDGTYGVYYMLPSRKPWLIGTLTVTEKWADSEGNIWYKGIGKSNLGLSSYRLWKISNSGNTYEETWDREDYPTTINPNLSKYLVYYRQ